MGGLSVGQQAPPVAVVTPQMNGSQPPQQPQQGEVLAYEGNNLRVVFRLSPGPQPNMALVQANFTNSGPHDVTAFNFQAAVPKYCKVQLSPASSQVVPANNGPAVTQALKLINNQFGQSPARILMRITGTINGQNFQDQKAVDLPGH
eukprot:c18833_g1_i3.p1 GENE.c18833_g1_i3~~c18833_g1_i3.p1  ORF type:complete len:147 (+),score=23.57 c18833_g1_i3:3-443(+)